VIRAVWASLMGRLLDYRQVSCTIIRDAGESHGHSPTE
jgi:hypothetical protein